jgi:hypothetical protein
MPPKRPPSPPLNEAQFQKRLAKRVKRRENPAGTPPALPAPALPLNTPPPSPSTQMERLLLGEPALPVGRPPRTPQGQIVPTMEDRLALGAFQQQPYNVNREQRTRDYLVAMNLMPQNPSDGINILQLGGRPYPMELYLSDVAGNAYIREQEDRQRQIMRRQQEDAQRRANRQIVQQRMATANPDAGYYIGTPPPTPPPPPVAGTPPRQQASAPPPVQRRQAGQRPRSPSSSPDGVFEFDGSGMRGGRLARYYKK